MNYSIEKLALPNGEARHELRVWERGRKAKQIKRRFKSRKEALAFVDKQMRAERKAQSLDPLSVRSFGEEYEFWRANKAKNFAPGWRKNLDGYWAELRAKLECVKLDKLESVVSRMGSEFETEGNSAKTIRNKLGLVKAVLRFSLETKRIQQNPLTGFKLPKARKTSIEFWEPEFAKSFLTHLSERYPRSSSERWIYIACLVALNTAMRAGEVWALRPRCLRRSQGVIHVCEQLNRVTHEFSETKGKEARNVPLNAELLSELEFWINSRGLRLGDLIFLSSGKPVNHDSFADLFDREVKAWGGPRITFHGLRHTAATLMLASGVDIKTLQAIMGHKDVQTTMKYVHLLGANVRRAAELFGIGPEKSQAPQLAVVG
jgi:integrase